MGAAMRKSKHTPKHELRHEVQCAVAWIEANETTMLVLHVLGCTSTHDARDIAPA